MDDRLTYYDLLGVSQDAAEEEIKKAHREHARALHPDRHEPGIREMMNRQLARVNHAADVLLDPDERGAYDQRLASEAPRQEDYYEPEDVGEYYREAARDRGYVEDKPPAPGEAPPPPEGMPAGLYERLVNPPPYADKLAVPVAYSVPYALIAIAPTALLGGNATGPAILFFGVWFLLIPAAAFLLSSVWARLRFAPARWVVRFFGSSAVVPRSLLPFVIRAGSHYGGAVDSSIRRGLHVVENFERGVAVLKVLWRGPLAFLALTVLIIIPGGLVLAGLAWLAAVLWCAGRVWVLRRSRATGGPQA